MARVDNRHHAATMVASKTNCFVFMGVHLFSSIKQFAMPSQSSKSPMQAKPVCLLCMIHRSTAFTICPNVAKPSHAFSLPQLPAFLAAGFFAVAAARAGKPVSGSPRFILSNLNCWFKLLKIKRVKIKRATARRGLSKSKPARLPLWPAKVWRRARGDAREGCAQGVCPQSRPSMRRRACASAASSPA